jgi:U3 small nucleolar RNA-associated protein 21
MAYDPFCRPFVQHRSLSIVLLQGLRLLSAGADRSFRLFSTIQDQQSRELSQKHTAARAKKLKVSQEELKLPRVTQLAASEVGG